MHKRRITEFRFQASIKNINVEVSKILETLRQKAYVEVCSLRNMKVRAN